ncbi:unnamed protein product, partial [Ectocarpus sp. 4 AP-2014]
MPSFAHEVSKMPGTGAPVFGYCFPPQFMAGHVVQHLAECRAHAIAVSQIPSRICSRCSSRRRFGPRSWLSGPRPASPIGPAGMDPYAGGHTRGGQWSRMTLISVRCTAFSLPGGLATKKHLSSVSTALVS